MNNIIDILIGTEDAKNVLKIPEGTIAARNGWNNKHNAEIRGPGNGNGTDILHRTSISSPGDPQ